MKLFSCKDRDIIIIEPHPDDAFLGMWNIMKSLKYGLSHNKYSLISVTAGSLNRHTKRLDDQLGKIRTFETKVMLEEMNIKHCYFLNYLDGSIDCALLGRDLVRICSAYKDPVILCPGALEYHVDHVSTRIAVDAVKRESNEKVDIIEYVVNLKESESIPEDEILRSLTYAKYKLNNEDKEQKKKEFEFIYKSQYTDPYVRDFILPKRLECEFLTIPEDVSNELFRCV